jgi:ABC-type transport system involved in multi-copper enzyme maturation permease subunit
VRTAAASLGAEWLKQFKRPAVWVLLVVLVAAVLLVRYGLVFLITTRAPASVELARGVTPESLRHSLYPAHFVQQCLAGLAGSVGAAIALILGVLGYGSEYGWATLKTVFTQGPSRLATMLGKVVALALALLFFVLATFAVCAGAAAAIGAVDGNVSTWPTPPVIVQGVLTAWLVVGMWAGLGVALSVLFRQSALAIGLGLVYAVVIEGLLVGLLAPLTEARAVAPALPGVNADVLVRSFGSAAPVSDAGVASQVQVAPEQAVLVVAAYLGAFLLITAVLLRTRDVT